MLRQVPIHELPPGYHEARHLVLTEGRALVWLNILSIIPPVIIIAPLLGWWILILRLRNPIHSDFVEGIPWFAGVLSVFVVMILAHEGLHGLAIHGVGHRARYGFKPSKGVFYATADNALFRRSEFLVVALAPLVVITIAGLILLIFVSDALAFYIGLLVVLNASGAIGDLWMSALVLRYPSSVLVRDEADSIRIYKLDVQAVEAYRLSPSGTSGAMQSGDQAGNSIQKIEPPSGGHSTPTRPS
jgi:hypothetical protein